MSEHPFLERHQGSTCFTERSHQEGSQKQVTEGGLEREQDSHRFGLGLAAPRASLLAPQSPVSVTAVPADSSIVNDAPVPSQFA